MPDDTYPSAIQVLNRHRIAITTARIAVIDLLRRSPIRHMHAEQLCAAMLKTNDQFGISTFRRAIYDLAGMGPLARVVIPDEKNRTLTFYELADRAVHRHLYCTQCGKLDEVFDDTLEQAYLGRFQSQHLKPANVDHALSGVCAECLRREHALRVGKIA